MLQKQPRLFIPDSTNIRWLQIFYLYKESFYKSILYWFSLIGKTLWFSHR